MEDIIIWIGLVAIGVAVEYLKKKRGTDNTPASSASVSSSRKPQRHHISDNTIQSILEPLTTAQGKSQAIRREPDSSPKAAPRATGSGYQPLDLSRQHTMAGDSQAMQTVTGNVGDNTGCEAGQAVLKAHYDRWRQAILDTQVLERKF